ncbi:thioesterase [SAR202 cluster bacterium AD-804-J14_MRT_500m]|nr:thioesterase [SAR202 cluster bacterium AD-804-J14_MRT_500m]
MNNNSDQLTRNVTPGLAGEMATIVSEKNRAPHVPVFSTPSLVALFEGASARALEGYLPPGFTSVGFEVNIRHLGPAPIGATVKATSAVSRLDGKKVYFVVEAWCGSKKIGDGTHSRALVPERFGNDKRQL